MELIISKTSILGKPSYNFAHSNIKGRQKELADKARNYDVTKDSYKEWILWWRESYKELSEDIRELKRMRKPAYIKQKYPNMAGDKAYSMAYEAASLIREHSLLATVMMTYRMEAKAARKKHFEDLELLA